MKNYWNVALIISLLFHTAIFATKLPLFWTNKIPETKKKINEIEITPKTIEKIKKTIKRKKIGLEKTKPLPYVENIMSKLTENKNFSTLKKPQIFKKTTKEILFSETAENNKKLKKNPAYMDYYRLVREKIRANAYHNYNSNKNGKILASFFVFSNGMLKNIHLNSKSANNEILKKITLKSINESAPFPPFPAELKEYSQLRFNISIYFRSK